MQATSSSSTLTRASDFTMNATAAREPGPVTILSLPPATMVHVAARVDKFATLHAMAATCTSWNASVSIVYKSLRDIGRAEYWEFDDLQNDSPLPADKVLPFALKYLESRLSENHRREEPPAPLEELSFGVVNLVLRQEPEMRRQVTEPFISIFKSFNAGFLTRLALLRLPPLMLIGALGKERDAQTIEILLETLLSLPLMPSSERILMEEMLRNFVQQRVSIANVMARLCTHPDNFQALAKNKLCLKELFMYAQQLIVLRSAKGVRVGERFVELMTETKVVSPQEINAWTLESKTLMNQANAKKT